jgi:hypothetical protein
MRFDREIPTERLIAADQRDINRLPVTFKSNILAWPRFPTGQVLSRAPAPAAITRAPRSHIFYEFRDFVLSCFCDQFQFTPAQLASQQGWVS